MRSLDQAVQKFKVLKQKLRHISAQTAKPIKNKPSYQKIDKDKDKQNNKNSQNKMIYSAQDTTLSLDDHSDSKLQTQKKGKHKKNMSYNFDQKPSKQLPIIKIKQQNKLTSLNSSRSSLNYTKHDIKDLISKQKTLQEINELLQRKKRVLQQIQRKIDSSSLLEDIKMEEMYTRSKKSIKAPNLFQMQLEGRKRDKSKPLTIRWK